MSGRGRNTVSRAPARPAGAAAVVRLLTIGDEVGSDPVRTAALSAALDGAEIRCASTLAEALEHARQGSFDVALLELDLSDSGGLSTLRALRSVAPRTAVIVLGHDDEIQVVREGAQECLAIDVEIQVLARAARMASERRRVQESQPFGEHAAPGVVNREQFYRRLREATTRARASGRLVGLLYVDVDGLKAVNDGYGHEVGDSVLRGASHRLLESVRDVDTVARMGGDEFAIVLDDLDQAASAGAVADRVLSAFSTPFQTGQHALRTTPSIGIALYPSDSDEVGELVKFADAAMGRAKRLGRNSFSFYNAGTDTRGLRRGALEVALRQALYDHQFVLHYQPQISLETGEVRGVEALIRWSRPDGSLVSPVEFVPILESTGLVIPVGNWVLAQACAQFQAWRRAGIACGRISVNLSAIQLLRDDFVAMVNTTLAETGLQPTELELELTEGAFLDSGSDGQARLAAVLATGVELAIDDFGTGYSTLGALRDLPASTVKIDRSLIRNIDGHEPDEIIATSCIDLLHRLGRKVVAEGVETAAQLEVVRRHGCDAVQGWYFAKAMPADELVRWLQGRSAGLDSAA